jgi:hypothetical protein
MDPSSPHLDIDERAADNGDQILGPQRKKETQHIPQSDSIRAMDTTSGARLLAQLAVGSMAATT